MKTINRLNSILFCCFGFLITLTSCFEQEDPLNDLIERTGNHYPVVANIRSLENQGYEVNFTPGGKVNLELQYWSLDPISEIGFYDIINDDTTLINSFPYEPAFSRISDTDTLVIAYDVPNLASDTDVILYLEVVNENGLTDYGTFSFTIE